MRPMLATATDVVPTGAQWVHEVKWDGMRVLADCRDGSARLTARSGSDVTVTFPELDPLGQLYDDLLLDGEVVALAQGRPSFASLADRMHVRRDRRARALAATQPVTFMAFDVLRLFGQDLTGAPWSARRQLLESLDLTGTHWQTPATADDGAALLAATAEQGLEGVVSKRRTSQYRPGRRSPDWLKLAHRQTVSAVVFGWRPEVERADRLGAVLVAVPSARGTWRYAGRCGSGLAGRAGARVLAALDDASSQDHGPGGHPDAPELPDLVAQVPPTDADTARWVTPRLVVEVRTLGHTDGGRLRHPTFLGVRHDLSPERLQEGAGESGG